MATPEIKKGDEKISRCSILLPKFHNRIQHAMSSTTCTFARKNYMDMDGGTPTGFLGFAKHAGKLPNIKVFRP